MNTETLFNRLVENALDFLARSIEEFESRPKYSVIHFHAAVELFLKARLMSDHWTLVVSRTQEPDWERFVAGDFISVSLDEAASKLDKAVQSGLTRQELRTFKDVTKHRNKMVHFFHEAHHAEQDEERVQEIVREQLNAWYLLHRLLVDRWKEVFNPWSESIREIDKELRKLRDYLEVVFDHRQEEIRRGRKAGYTFESCPSCGFEAQENQQELDEVYDACCLVCGLVKERLKIECSCGSHVNFMEEGFSECDSCGNKFEPKDIVDILQDEEKAYRAAKDGDDSWDLGNCGDCDGYHTVVRVDFDHYFCASCFGRFDSMQPCEYCCELNTEDMGHSYVSGCNHCDGPAGWHKDD